MMWYRLLNLYVDNVVDGPGLEDVEVYDVDVEQDVAS